MGRSLISDYGFEDSLFHDEGAEWDASTLYKAVKDQKLKPYKYPLKYLNMEIKRFKWVDTIADMAHHVKRVFNADLDIPIILSPNGGVVDGYHRMIKALALGNDHIMVYRLEEMPKPDRTGVE